MKTCDVGRLHQLVGDERWAEFRETNSKGDCGFVQCAASSAPAPDMGACIKLVEDKDFLPGEEAAKARADTKAQRKAAVDNSQPADATRRTWRNTVVLMADTRDLASEPPASYEAASWEQLVAVGNMVPLLAFPALLGCESGL